ncbi:MAG: hypothetical protein ACYTAF_06105 [Planctomycetota bacterium]|jgi:hypothetical protein
MTEKTEPAAKPARKTSARKIREEIVHEYPAVGRYRVRVVRGTSARNGGVTTLDVREYVVSDTFEGFTRRGIRLGATDQINRLRDCLADAVVRGWFDGLPADGNGSA